MKYHNVSPKMAFGVSSGVTLFSLITATAISFALVNALPQAVRAENHVPSFYLLPQTSSNPPPTNPKTQEAPSKVSEVEPAPEVLAVRPDCTGLLETRDVFQSGRKSVQSKGRFAIGHQVGETFVPILYFNQLGAAKKCAQDFEVREWVGGRWKPSPP